MADVLTADHHRQRRSPDGEICAKESHVSDGDARDAVDDAESDVTAAFALAPVTEHLDDGLEGGLTIDPRGASGCWDLFCP